MEAFVGQLLLVPYNFAPRGWAFCNGQLLPIAQNTALFSLLGVNYGGNGTSTFALPNLQGSSTIHQGQGPGLQPYVIGQAAGEANVTLVTAQMPAHNHVQQATSSVATSVTPGNAAFGASGGRGHAVSFYVAPSSNTTMNASALTPAGSNQPHLNMMPYLTLNYIIALQGVYPSRN